MDNWEDWENVDQANFLPEVKTETPVSVVTPVHKTTNNTASDPQNFLSENALKAAHPYFEFQPAMKILSRKSRDQETDSSMSTPPPQLKSPPTLGQQTKSLQERERDYNEARRRILSGTDSPQQSGTTNEQERPKILKDNQSGQPVTRQPKPPSDTPGFGVGRGKPVRQQ